jgi:hypothetical protein
MEGRRKGKPNNRLTFKGLMFSLRTGKIDLANKVESHAKIEDKRLHRFVLKSSSCNKFFEIFWIFFFFVVSKIQNISH